jgi:hypothetical protein
MCIIKSSGGHISLLNEIKVKVLNLSFINSETLKAEKVETTLVGTTACCVEQRKL